MKKIVVGGLIALAMTTAFTAAQAAIPDGDGISSGSPPGLIASSTETIIAPTNPALAIGSIDTPALAFFSFGTKGDAPAMVGIKTSSPALVSPSSGVATASIGGGTNNSKADISWAQASRPNNDGISNDSPPGGRQVAG